MIGARLKFVKRERLLRPVGANTLGPAMRAETITFAMLNEAGHLNPTFKLAQALAERGHHVRYLATDDVAELIRARGFTVDPLYPDLFPRGVTAADQKLGRLAQRRAITARYAALLARLQQGSPLDVTPSLLVVDVTQTQMALWARRTKQRFVYLNTSLPQTQDPGVPPLRSAAPYGGDTLTRFVPELAWRRFVAQRRTSAELAALGGMRPPYDLARAAAARFGVSTAELETRVMYMPQLRGVPELVLCPEPFDFPRAASPDRHYIESSDLTRPEAEFAWAGLARDKPLVYCALGSQRYRAEDVPGFFARLVEVFRARPDWQLLLAVNQHVAADSLAPPQNVCVVTRAPQLKVLERAALMITHGGLGSVKECLMRGVPMVGVPLDVDQPGNVARVLHHQLGVAADVKHTGQRDLHQLIGRVLGDVEMRQRVLAMQQRFRQHEAGSRGVELIEGYARA
ncbi:MAG TPA: glycosyltransferase [Polyangiales bacterium]|nr:glycosyltransferase [Polyangiales bacterium]